MKMHVLSGGRLRMRKSVYVPTAAKTEQVELPVVCILLRHAQGNVLFDTGCHPGAATDPQGRWGGMARMMSLISPHDENVITGLAGLGLEAEDIDVVVNSHFHTDHCGCNEFFRRASIVCSARELAAAGAEGAERAGYLDIDWKHPMPLDAFEGERDLFGDARIVLVPLPGHTPGSIGALVTLDKCGRFLCAADAVALHDNLEVDCMPRNMWNTEVAARTVEEIRRIEAGGATVIFGHDAAQWDTLRKGTEAYD